MDEIIVSENKAVLKSEITLSSLDFMTFEKLSQWHYHNERLARWDWHSVRKTYKTHPKRFELSIWHHKHFLTGASIGRPTWSGNKLRLDFIEANPSKSPLSGVITDIVIVAASVYADAIGASQIRIMQPVNEKVRNYYLSKPGFQYNAKENFCYRNM